MRTNVLPFPVLVAVCLFVNASETVPGAFAVEKKPPVAVNDTSAFEGAEEDSTEAVADSPAAAMRVPRSKNADSIAADSAKKALRGDSLAAAKAAAMRIYSTFPSRIDSLYPPATLDRQTIFSSDAISLSEIAGRLPQVVTVPLSLSNNLSRPMPYGFPLPGPLFTNEGMGGFEAADAFTGTDRMSSEQVSAVRLDPFLRFHLTPHVDDVVVPEIGFLWENGVFVENILNARFVRPITRDLTIGIFSNNRFFKPQNYSTKNDLKSLYGYFITDTNLTSQGGKNPLVEDQNTELRFSGRGRRGERRSFSVSYHDEKNEISYESPDSTGKKSLRWDRLFQYGTIADAGVEGIRLDPAFFDIRFHMESGGHSRTNPYSFAQQTGKKNEFSLFLRPSIPFGGDTVFLNARVTRYDQTLYDRSRPKTMQEELSIAAAHYATVGKLNASIAGSIGQCFISRNKPEASKNDWIGSLTAEIKLPRQMVRAFAQRACAPFPDMYDSMNAAVFPSHYNSLYESFGAEYYGAFKKVGLMTGVCGMSGYSGGDSLNIWPGNVLPYRQPRIAYVVSPVFGQWHGFSASSRWMLSDKRPYIKTRTSVSYKAHPLGGREHILLDLVYDYWSVRDPLMYGGDSLWSREIGNLSLSTAVQIKTFSLFYKIDNILNRKYSYVPGYRMPGITFRWGFQWLLQG